LKEKLEEWNEELVIVGEEMNCMRSLFGYEKREKRRYLRRRYLKR